MSEPTLFDAAAEVKEKSRRQHPNFVDRTGNRYGSLTVLGYAGSYKGLCAAWRCQCDCGNEMVSAGASLRSGRTISCGCVGRQRFAAARRYYDNQYTDNSDGSTTLTITRKCDGKVMANVLIDTADRDLLSRHPWSVSPKNYIVTSGMKKMQAVLGYPPDSDHADRDRKNNRRGNLRPATRAQQTHNRGKQRNSRNRFKGIGRVGGVERGGRPWKAFISVNSRRIYLGVFATDVDAARAYDAAALKYHGEFACLNFPPSL